MDTKDIGVSWRFDNDLLVPRIVVYQQIKTPHQEQRSANDFVISPTVWNNFSVDSSPLRDLVASSGSTHCNEFLPTFFNLLDKKVYNDVMPSGTNADKSALGLTKYFQTNPNLRNLNEEHCQPEASVLAQEAANRGALVIAASEGTEKYDPHVAIVAPQSSVYHSLPRLSRYEGTTGEIAHDQSVKNPIEERDYPVFLQAGTYTGYVPPGYAFSRDMFDQETVKYYIYEPKE